MTSFSCFNSATACYAVETPQPGHRRRDRGRRFNSATACYAVETSRLPSLTTSRLMLQFGHGLLCRGNPGFSGQSLNWSEASIRPRLVMPWKQRPGAIMTEQEWGFNSATACYAVETRKCFRRRYIRAWLQFGHGLLCRGNNLVWVFWSFLVFRLQFGHGLLCRGNLLCPHRLPGRASRFNSATACYAVETALLRRRGRRHTRASIRPRLVMPWKLDADGFCQTRIGKLQFGHGLLCRGNVLRHVHLRRHDAELQFGHGLLCRGNGGKGAELVGNDVHVLQFGHGLLCRGNAAASGRHRPGRCQASIRPRLVMPWKPSQPSGNPNGTPASIRPRLVMPWKH